MGDYIRGKKAYTKWDADSENIDIEYRPDAQKKQIQDGWLSGTKGKVIKVLLVLLVFCLGLITGFFLRRGVVTKEVSKETVVVSHNEEPAYSSTPGKKQELLNLIQVDNIKQFLKNYTLEPHIAGKLANKKYANHIKDLWQTWGIDNVHIEKFRVMLSYPSNTKPNIVQLINRKNNKTLKIASESGDDELHPDLRPYLAYSPNGTAEGKLVYVNYGRKEDFEYLHFNKSINLTGCIAIMRMGQIHIANKIKFAEDFGIVGTILYPDPIDYVHGVPIYPDGLGLPGDGIIRGSLNLLPGDPITPIQPATEYAYRQSKVMFSIPRIPVQPISYNNALKFMNDMDGPPGNESWKGGLNISYLVGPGHKDKDLSIEMILYNEFKEEEVFNVLGSLKGKFEPDRYIIFGNHYDSWTNGTGDPGTGLASFLEAVRALGEFTKTGWKPGRTLVFALWDAKEFGMIGSTEWLEMHRDELASRALVYINTDAAIMGTEVLSAMGSPLLLKAFTAAAQEKAIEDAYHHWLSMHSIHAENIEPQLEILGGSSDYVTFMSCYGISSLHLYFENEDPVSKYKLSYSAYDDFEAFSYVDPRFEVAVTISKLLASLALELSDSLKMPVNTEDYGMKVMSEFHKFHELYSSELSELNVSLDSLELAVKTFDKACLEYHNNFQSVNEHEELLGYHEYNDRAMELERALISRHSDSFYKVYYRHVLFGPHPDNKNIGIFLPEVVNLILKIRSLKKQSQVDLTVVVGLKYELSQVISCLYGAVGVLNSSILKYQM
uniref:Peptidase M28 domain-containing protein n=1 Tax=Strigamia maritima TaxID=126957 RepID=T1ISE6_STRMM